MSSTADRHREVEALRRRVTELEELVDAIRGREVDALVLGTSGHESVYTLTGAETPYRLFVEQMEQGALTLTNTGTIAFANQSFADLLGLPLEQVTGQPLAQFAADPDRLQAVRAAATAGRVREELELRTAAGGSVPVALSLALMPGEPACLCGVVNDLRARRQLAELKMSEAASRESEARFRALADAAPAILWVTDADNACTLLSRGWYEFTGQEQGEGLGQGWLAAVHPDDRPHARRSFFAAVAARAPLALEHRILSRDGDVRWVLDLGHPRFGPEGEFLGYVGSVVDITDRRRAEQALRESEERLRVAAEAARFGTYDVDMAAGEIVLSSTAEEILGLAPGEANAFDAERARALLHPEDADDARAALERSLDPAGDGRLDTIQRIVGPDGEERWVRCAGRTIWERKAGARRPLRLVGTILDMTERMEYETHLRTVMSELNHRVKNTLATVNAIAQKTLSRETSLARYRSSFSDRLRSMAAAHGLLTRADWTGADLRDILLTELKPRIATPRHLHLNGPPVILRPKPALALHMALHELTTNASKYGALAAPDGRVEVTWQVVGGSGGEQVQLDWKELDGPPVKEPRESGFGSQMIASVIEYELEGATERHYEPNGLRCRISFPLGGTGTVGRRAPRSGKTPGSAQPDRVSAAPGLPRVLVVEDSMPLAFTLCEELESAGFATAGPVPRLDEALALARAGDLDAALLDVDLDGTRVYPLARDLAERGIPFALLTGYSADDMPPDLRDRPILGKPVDPRVLREWLRRATGR